MSSIPPKFTINAPKRTRNAPAKTKHAGNFFIDNQRKETALYISQLSSELAALARRHGLDSVAYFLEMARREAALIEQVE